MVVDDSKPITIKVINGTSPPIDVVPILIAGGAAAGFVGAAIYQKSKRKKQR